MACPQKLTSASGLKYRTSNPSWPATRKAVSEKPTSAAIGSMSRSGQTGGVQHDARRVAPVRVGAEGGDRMISVVGMPAILPRGPRLDGRRRSLDELAPGQPHLLDVEPGLDLAQHDVVDALLVAQPRTPRALAGEEGEREAVYWSSCCSTGSPRPPVGREQRRGACRARGAPARPPSGRCRARRPAGVESLDRRLGGQLSASWSSSATEVSTGSRANRTTGGSSSAWSRVSTITPAVTKTIRSRPGNGRTGGQRVRHGEDAASETAPRNPATALTCAAGRRPGAAAAAAGGRAAGSGTAWCTARPTARRSRRR